MKHLFTITSFNDPASCRKCMSDMAAVVPDGVEKNLQDQSGDEFAVEYQALCKEFGYRYGHLPNHGAQVTKHNVIREAARGHYDFLSQISEDFELTPPEKLNGKVVSGRQHFWADAMKLLISRPHISFVNWTFVREGGYGYHWHRNPPRMALRNTPDVSLMWLDGDISLFNWPYTGRVSALAEMLAQATLVTPNSEGAMAKASLGHGVCLLAQPVRHTGRKKPEGSKP